MGYIIFGSSLGGLLLCVVLVFDRWTMSAISKDTTDIVVKIVNFQLFFY